MTATRHSRSIVYCAKLADFQKVVLFLLQDCCGGRPEIPQYRLKAHRRL